MKPSPSNYNLCFDRQIINLSLIIHECILLCLFQVSTGSGGILVGQGSSLLPSLTNAQGQPVSPNALGQSGNTNVQSELFTLNVHYCITAMSRSGKELCADLERLLQTYLFIVFGYQMPIHLPSLSIIKKRIDIFLFIDILIENQLQRTCCYDKSIFQL
jgi:hypothetical protein